MKDIISFYEFYIRIFKTYTDLFLINEQEIYLEYYKDKFISVNSTTKFNIYLNNEVKKAKYYKLV